MSRMLCSNMHLSFGIQVERSTVAVTEMCLFQMCKFDKMPTNLRSLQWRYSWWFGATCHLHIKHHQAKTWVRNRFHLFMVWNLEPNLYRITNILCCLQNRRIPRGVLNKQINWGYRISQHLPLIPLPIMQANIPSQWMVSATAAPIPLSPRCVWS